MISFFTIIESSVLINDNLTNTDKIVYSIISSFSNNKKGYCYARYKDIAKYSGIKERELYYIIKKLIDLKLISRYRQNNRYYLAPTINILSKNKKDIIKDKFYYNWLEEE